MTDQQGSEHRTDHGVAQRIIGWLRAGYPAGVPRKDYIALLGVLHRRLTSDEIEGIAGDLAAVASAESEITEQEIIEAIRQHTHQQPDEDDIRRVRSHLALGGWPLASVEQAVAETDAPPAEDDPEDTRRH